MLAEAKIVYALIGGIGAPELLVIFAIVLLLFGGKKLPEVARSMGSAMRAFRDEASQIRREVELEAEREEKEKGQTPSAEGERSTTTPDREAQAEPDKRGEEQKKVEQKG